MLLQGCDPRGTRQCHAALGSLLCDVWEQIVSVHGVRFTCQGRERYLYIELLVLEFPIEILDLGIVRCLKATLMLWFAHVVADHKMLIGITWRNYGGCLGRGRR